MGVLIPRHHLYLHSFHALVLAGCGIEQDYQAWQDAAQASTQIGDSDEPPDRGSTSLSTISSTSIDETTGPDTLPETSSISEGGDGSSSTDPGDDTSAQAVLCGDGVREGAEECDDPDDPACHACVRDRLVFVTSESGSGAFATDADVDYLCNHLADIAGLLDQHQPRFRAWISTSEASAADRLHHSPGRYVLRNGQVLANGWDQLISGQLLGPPNIDELGLLREVTVWTDTLPDGRAAPGSSHCDDWTSDALESVASWGYSGSSDGEWTQWADEEVNPNICTASQGLYCFESP